MVAGDTNRPVIFGRCRRIRDMDLTRSIALDLSPSGLPMDRPRWVRDPSLARCLRSVPGRVGDPLRRSPRGVDAPRPGSSILLSKPMEPIGQRFPDERSTGASAKPTPGLIRLPSMGTAAAFVRNDLEAALREWLHRAVLHGRNVHWWPRRPARIAASGNHGRPPVSRDRVPSGVFSVPPEKDRRSRSARVVRGQGRRRKRAR